MAARQKRDLLNLHIETLEVVKLQITNVVVVADKWVKKNELQEIVLPITREDWRNL